MTRQPTRPTHPKRAPRSPRPPASPRATAAHGATPKKRPAGAEAPRTRGGERVAAPSAEARRRSRAGTATAADAGAAAASGRVKPARGRGRPKKSDGEANQPPLEAGVHLIRRYGNRRLYDTQLSRCVTLGEIADFVRAGENVRIVDADSGADLTKRMLVQIILEEPGTGPNLELFPVELLRMAVTLRNEKQLAWLERYLTVGSQWLSGQVPGARPASEAAQGAMSAFLPWLSSGAPNPFGGTSPFPNPFASAFANPFAKPAPTAHETAAHQTAGRSEPGAARAEPGAARADEDRRAPREAPINEAVYSAAGEHGDAEDGATLRDEVAELRRRLVELDSRVKRR